MSERAALSYPRKSRRAVGGLLAGYWRRAKATADESNYGAGCVENELYCNQRCLWLCIVIRYITGQQREQLEIDSAASMIELLRAKCVPAAAATATAANAATRLKSRQLSWLAQKAVLFFAAAC